MKHAFLLVFVIGCGAAGVPQADRELFTRCSHSMAQAAGCPPGSAVCMGVIRRRFIEQPTYRDREIYVVSNGCPVATVRPAQALDAQAAAALLDAPPTATPAPAPTVEPAAAQ